MKKKIQTFKWLALSIALFMLVFLFILDLQQIAIQIGPPPIGISHTEISVFFIVVAVISMVSLSDDKSTMSVIIGFGMILILIIWWPPKEYTVLSSDDNEQHFIVVETFYSDIYKYSKSKLYMTLEESVSADDGYAPFSKGDYRLIWRYSELIIYVPINDLQSYDEIKIPLD